MSKANDMSEFRILALSGSLRVASLNTAMLNMATLCLPPGLHMSVHTTLGDLPLFNPDLESHAPSAVEQLQGCIAAADALLIASPEYVHGVSSVMKNALDWMVGSGVFVDKPVVLWNAAPRATHALAALRETLTVMSARLLVDAELALLIQQGALGQAPSNPDQAAMRRAMVIIKNTLVRERSAQGSRHPLPGPSWPR